MMRGLNHHTVRDEADCANVNDLWGMSIVTTICLGDKCTRACSFCNVTTGKPTELDVLEPFRAAEAVAAINLYPAVIASVNRDDLDDGVLGSSPTPSPRRDGARPTPRSRSSSPTSRETRR